MYSRDSMYGESPTHGLDILGDKSPHAVIATPQGLTICGDSPTLGIKVPGDVPTLARGGSGKPKN